jgi:hypothetical protein
LALRLSWGDALDSGGVAFRIEPIGTNLRAGVHPLAYLLFLVGAVVLYIALIMLFVGGLRPSELRDRAIASVLDTYTHQGFSIPGVRRGRLAAVALWLLRYDGPDAPTLRPPRGPVTLTTAG